MFMFELFTPSILPQKTFSRAENLASYEKDFKKKKLLWGGGTFWAT